MATAAIYGLLASSSLVVGVLLGLATKPPRRLLAVVIAFGAGVLVSALTFDLMGEAFERETGAYAITGFLVGAIIYVLADAGLERLAARSPQTHRPRPPRRGPRGRGQGRDHRGGGHHGTCSAGGGLIDGIPESAAIGLSLHAEGRSLGLVLLAAVFLANVPESLGSAGAMREEGRSRGYIIGVWTGVAVVCVLATMAGYGCWRGCRPAG